MTRCRDCHASLKPEETFCAMCEAPVPRESKQTVYAQRFGVFLKIAFFACLGLTVASLFLPLSFVKCAVATVILHFVKSSSDQMLEKTTKI